MTHRFVVAGVIAALAASASAPSLAQGAKQAAAPAAVAKTSWGKPDLSGTWTNGSLTTLERPAEYGTRAVLTPAEVAKLEGAEADARKAGNAPTNPSFTIKDLPVDCGRGFTGTNCGYNSGWVDPGSTVMRVNGEPRASFITTTPNGRIPAAKPEATQRAQARQVRRPGMGPVDNPEQRALGERCIMSFGNSSGPIMQPQLYNNNYQFIQTPDELAIWVEMVHDVRHIRIGAKHRTDGVRTWMGDSIGWWDGNTLVAETINYHPNQGFRGGVTDENLKVTERFTRLAPSRILYQFKVEDPTVWDTAWGGEYEFTALGGQVYEYACHEGNYALEGILAGARAEEAAAAQKTASK